MRRAFHRFVRASSHFTRFTSFFPISRFSSMTRPAALLGGSLVLLVSAQQGVKPGVDLFQRLYDVLKASPLVLSVLFLLSSVCLALSVSLICHRLPRTTPTKSSRNGLFPSTLLLLNLDAAPRKTTALFFASHAFQLLISLLLRKIVTRSSWVAQRLAKPQPWPIF
jgi:hypothetical protein